MRLPEWNNYRNEAGVFCDQFNPEFSRDCEPVKGFWGDAYYWQLVANVRRYKGVHEIPPTVSRPIRIDGNFDDWRDVQPEFRDTVGDEVRRDFTAHGTKAGRYVDMSGRNDIVAAKVSRNGNDICFYVRTREPMTAPDGQDWMKLFIDADRSAATGWLGYDFMVERTTAERGGSHAGRTVLRMHDPGKRTACGCTSRASGLACSHGRRRWRKCLLHGLGKRWRLPSPHRRSAGGYVQTGSISSGKTIRSNHTTGRISRFTATPPPTTATTSAFYFEVDAEL